MTTPMTSATRTSKVPPDPADSACAALDSDALLTASAVVVVCGESNAKTELDDYITLDFSKKLNYRS